MASIECDFLKWEFRCPKSWERLKLTSRADVRFCNACHENVYAVADKEAAQALANEGKCIAIVEVSEDYYEKMSSGIVSSSETKGDPRLRKIDLENKISTINARIKTFGETPEQLARLKRLYSLLIEAINEIEEIERIVQIEKRYADLKAALKKPNVKFDKEST